MNDDELAELERRLRAALTGLGLGWAVAQFDESLRGLAEEAEPRSALGEEHGRALPGVRGRILGLLDAAHFALTAPPALAISGARMLLETSTSARRVVLVDQQAGEEPGWIEVPEEPAAGTDVGRALELLRELRSIVDDAEPAQ